MARFFGNCWFSSFGFSSLFSPARLLLDFVAFAFVWHVCLIWFCFFFLFCSPHVCVWPHTVRPRRFLPDGHHVDHRRRLQTRRRRSQGEYRPRLLTRATTTARALRFPFPLFAFKKNRRVWFQSPICPSLLSWNKMANEVSLANSAWTRRVEWCVVDFFCSPFPFVSREIWPALT